MYSRGYTGILGERCSWGERGVLMSLLALVIRALKTLPF